MTTIMPSIDVPVGLLRDELSELCCINGLQAEDRFDELEDDEIVDMVRVGGDYAFYGDTLRISAPEHLMFADPASLFSDQCCQVLYPVCYNLKRKTSGCSSRPGSAWSRTAGRTLCTGG